MNVTFFTANICSDEVIPHEIRADPLAITAVAVEEQTHPYAYNYYVHLCKNIVFNVVKNLQVILPMTAGSATEGKKRKKK